MEKVDIVIVGGGAAGLAAAIAAKRQTPQAQVVILEAADRVGKKILETGNGRCNLSNTQVGPEDYNSPAFVEPVISRYPYSEIARFFQSLGLTMEDDGQGRVFPKTYTASSVLDVLRLGCSENGVVVRCGVEVHNAIPTEPDGFALHLADDDLWCQRLILATGGLSDATKGLYAGLLGDGALTQLLPGLVPLETDTEPIKGLSGIRVRCVGTLFDLAGDETRVLFSDEGEILFRDYGISGILAMDFSRFMRHGGDFVCYLDLVPGVSINDLEEMLEQRRADFSQRQAREFLVGMLQSRVAEAVLRSAGIAPDAVITEQDASILARALKEFRIPIKGSAPRQKHQVVCGGVSRKVIDPVTLEALQVPGLYVVGEALDVDGRCGGFNLHWAWASGITAGAAAAAGLAKAGTFAAKSPQAPGFN